MTTIAFRPGEIKDNFKNECVLLRTICKKGTTLSRYVLLALVLFGAALGVSAFWLRPDAPPVQASLALAEAMGGS